MSGSVLFPHGVRMCVLESSTRLRAEVDSFIRDVAARVEKSQDLTESVLRAVEAMPAMERYFVIEPENVDRTFGLRDEYLYGQSSLEILSWASHHTAEPIGLPLDDADARERAMICRMMADIACGSWSPDQLRSRISEQVQALFDGLVECGFVVVADDEAIPFASKGQHGVFRLQHASLLYRTATTGILVDPHLNSNYEPRELRSNVLPRDLAGKVDGILISHSHGDHWSLSTLMMFPLDLPIVVPKVPRPTIICQDMAARLKSMGFCNVISVDWYSAPIQIGDMEIEVLPFYGEQPLRYEECKDSCLRNWGNTYLLSTAAYKSWFLIDSGEDVRGSMLEVAQYVRRKHGRVDFLLSNLRRFKIVSPLYINGGLNWLTLSAEQVRRFHHMRDHCVTLGPPGVAEICGIANVDVYLPYAHWWGNLGEIADNTGGKLDQNEETLIRELQDQLCTVGAPTKIVSWKIGDGFVAKAGGGFAVAPLG